MLLPLHPFKSQSALGNFENLVRKPMPPGQDIRLARRCCFSARRKARKTMLKLRTIGIVTTPCSKATSTSAGSASPTSGCPPIWLWTVTVHLTGGLPMGQAGDLDTARADFKSAWEVLKAGPRRISWRRPMGT